MEFIRIQSMDNIFTDELIKLYLESFPENQRRSVSEFKALLGSDDRFHCNAVLLNNELVAFYNYWDFEDFYFVEHLALEPPLRGYKLGEKIINLVRKNLNLPLVLEVEPIDASEWGSRRIEFYHRLGFQIIPQKYKQPPYRKGDNFILLHLMCDYPEFAEENFENIKEIIYKNVYRVGSE